MRALQWIRETKGSIGAILFALALVGGLASASRVPAKLDAHIAKTGEQLDETNRQLRVLVCLQARLHTAGQCLVETK